MPQRYTIGPGDSLANVAYDHGLLIETIWQHPDNEALRSKRPDMNILMPGDVVLIPDKRRGEHSVVTDKRHRFQLKNVPHVFRLQLFEDDEPRSRQPYKLKVQGRDWKRELSGTTDGDGVLTAHILPGATKARLVIEEDENFEKLELDILLGSLDPVEELAGVQKRLVNLGFDCPMDGQPSAETTAAIKAFQRQFDLSETGEVDSSTRSKLAQMNDEVSAFPPEPPETG